MEEEERKEKELWTPKTEIGRKVQSGEITDIGQLLKAKMPIMEVEIVDKLLPELEEEVVNVRRVQRTLDSGRRMRFSILAVVGDRNGHVGVGLAKGVEAGPTIRKAIARAKLKIIEIKRTCSSWECGCGEPHTVPFKVTGKNGSVAVTLKPAPRGLGLVCGGNSKTILELAGVKDVWVSSSLGHARTVLNQVRAVFDALDQINKFKVDTKTGKELEIKAETA
ncbi:MAG: 30S ribosomal protein S5 [Candidatus Altiarchaeota archaeon]|nr:30S ribosomal protein S5 [Candidatus Altiarchaeota archaeon]